MTEKPVEVGKRIRELREEKGMGLQDLAAKTGYSSALLSQFENHLISPPLGALIKLAGALEVEVSDFLGNAKDEPFTLIRHDERKVVSRVASRTGVNLGYTYESLGFGMRERGMEPFIVTLEPVALKEKHLSTHEGEEFLFVLEGRMLVRLGDHTDTLEPGDSIYFRCTTPHHVTCEGKKSARILAVILTGKQGEK
ncbi:HTH-type transcriptional regulator PuuR [bacterium BMS3Abin14]|nr:HTH-type transcriptional regulator PuuR [bacterium BMS3Abin14]